MQISNFELAALTVGAIFAAYGIGIVRGIQLASNVGQQQAQLEDTYDEER